MAGPVWCVFYMVLLLLFFRPKRIRYKYFWLLPTLHTSHRVAGLFMSQNKLIQQLFFLLCLPSDKEETALEEKQKNNNTIDRVS